MFCGCPAVNSSVNNLEMKLIRVCREYGLLAPQARSTRALGQNFQRKILNSLNEAEGLQVGEDFINSVLRNEVVSAIPSNMLLVNYLNALNYIKKAYVNPIDEEKIIYPTTLVELQDSTRWLEPVTSINDTHSH